MLVAEERSPRDQLARAMAIRMGVGFFTLADGVDPAVARLCQRGEKDQKPSSYARKPRRLMPWSALGWSNSREGRCAELAKTPSMKRYTVFAVWIWTTPRNASCAIAFQAAAECWGSLMPTSNYLCT